VGIRLDGQAKGTRQTEISQLNVSALGIDQQVLWLQIPMENSVLMQVDKSLKNLEQKALGLLLGQRLVALLLHILF